MAVLARVLPRRLMINGGAIFAGEAAARLATFLIAVVVARGFGSVALGQYGFAVAVASVLLLVPDSGLHLFIVRELAAAPERLRPIFWGVHWLKLPLLALVLTLSFLVGQLAIHDGGRRLILYVLLAKIALQTFSQAYSAIFKAFERMHFIAVQQFANAFFTAICVGGALLLHASLTVIVLALVAGQALETYLGWRIARSFFSPGPACGWKGESSWPMLLASAPMGVAAILQALNLRLDILTLSPFASNRVLGNYQAAAWFPVGTFLFVSLVMTTLFPKLARVLHSPCTQGNAYIESLLKNGVLLMAAGSIVAGFLAPYLLRGFFGGDLLPAVSTLRILIAALPCIFINTTMFYVFVAANRRGAYLTALLLGVLAGGALSVVLSARYGPNGTALAYILREFLISVVYLCFLKAGDFAQSAGRSLLKILACAAALIVVVMIVSNSTVFGSAWRAAWSFALVSGTVVFMGWPRLREMLLLADDDL